jgi:hypothetical protein
MQTLRLLILGLLAFVALGAAAQQDIAGTWTGKLAIAPDQELTVNFVLTAVAGGGYAAVLTSPDNSAINNVAATDVSFAGGKLSLKVPTLSGAYDGTLANGAFDGQWTQPGSELPLKLTPYKAAVFTQAAKDSLLGSWVGTITGPLGAVVLVMRYEVNAAGEFVAVLDQPEQGARGVPLADVMLDGDKLSWRVPQAAAQYTGTLQNGRFVGTFAQGGGTVPLEFAKGEYKPKDLNLSAAAMSALGGTWQGKIAAPDGSQFTLAFTFESSGADQSAAFMQILERSQARFLASEAVFDAGKLTLRIGGIGAQFVGTVSGTTMAGTWTAGGMDTPLTLTKQ